MTPTPTPEQIETEMFTARCCTTDRDIAEAIANARIEERNAALDEAATHAFAHADDRQGRYKPIDWHDGYLDGCRGASKSILALKTKEPTDEGD